MLVGYVVMSVIRAMLVFVLVLRVSVGVVLLAENTVTVSLKLRKFSVNQLGKSYDGRIGVI